MAKSTEKDGSLMRLGGGRWQTGDGRFTVEPQSGTWVVVDAEQADDLGLPLVRGPFRSLAAAKDAIGAARGAEPAVSPLAAQVARLRDRKAAPPAAARERHRTAPAPRTKSKPVEPEAPAEPRWLPDLEPAERRRARELIDRLTEAGAIDPEGMAYRDIVGNVPAAAAFAIARAMEALGQQPPTMEVARSLAEGRDAGLGVRWRLVDGENRPITLDLPVGRSPKRGGG